jgi:hypothetical protein
MRLTNVVQEWFTERKWEEKPEYDEENQKSTIGFDWSIDDFGLKCFFEADEAMQTFKIFIYYAEPKVPEKRLEEVKRFVYLINNNSGFGQLNLLENDRVIRYYDAIDVENASFEPAHITNMVNAGVNILKFVIPKYMAVCFGSKSAADAMVDDE